MPKKEPYTRKQIKFNVWDIGLYGLKAPSRVYTAKDTMEEVRVAEAIAELNEMNICGIYNDGMVVFKDNTFNAYHVALYSDEDNVRVVYYTINKSNKNNKPRSGKSKAHKQQH